MKQNFYFLILRSDVATSKVNIYDDIIISFYDNKIAFLITKGADLKKKKEKLKNICDFNWITYA